MAGPAAPSQVSSMLDISNAGASASTISLPSVVAGRTLILVQFCKRASTGAGELIATPSDDKGNTWVQVGREIGQTEDDGTLSRRSLAIYAAYNVAGGTTVVTPKHVNASANYGWALVMEVPGLLAAAAADKYIGANVLNSESSKQVVTAGLAQADEFAVFAAGSKWWWNYGGSSGPTTAPTDGTLPGSFVVCGEQTDNSASKCTGQVAYKGGIAATTAQEATQTVPSGNGDGGFFILATFKASTAGTNLRVRCTGLPAAINGVANISGLVWPSAPQSYNGAPHYRNADITAEAAGGIVLITPAPSWATAGQTVQVLLYKTAANLSTGLFPATVESY